MERIGDSFLQQTNESRQNYAKNKARARKIVTTSLMDLGAWVRDNGREIVGAPRALLEKTMKHVLVRLDVLTELKSNSRIRAQMKWLRRWESLIGIELFR